MRWSIPSTRKRPIAAVTNALILLSLLGTQPTWRDLPLVSSRSKMIVQRG